jgi:hypothetical protein
MPKVLVDAETSITETKTRKPRAKKPQSLEQVTLLANSLTLQEKVTLVNHLKGEIKLELSKVQEIAKTAAEIANGI